MIQLQLAGHSERITSDATFFPQSFGKYTALEAQQRTYEALAFGPAGIVLNTYATGSGKTKAALLYLHRLAEQRANCLFIAPTNELLMQHTADIATFCQTNQLDYQVLPLTRAHMDDYAEQISQVDPHVKRRAAKLERVLRDPRSLEDVNGQVARPQQPYILVTNPDIFYQAVFRGYGRNEEREVMKQFIAYFNYVIIDEFHYYNPKQTANFLFFFKLWEKFGYFANGAKVCLLSATPNRHIQRYLGSLGVTIAEISPDNEPADGNEQYIPSLAPVDLSVYTTDEFGSDGFIALVLQQLPDIKRCLDFGQQGAIISGALWRINLIYDLLRSAGIVSERIGRITGPQSREDRAAATTCDLILATPTVDLGYNFERSGKTRQSIDFLIFDAAFADEFVQRLGRAGRVLGKPETEILSTVVALVPPALGNVLRPLADHTVSRAELRSTLSQAIHDGTLKERQAIFEYVATGAIFEAFLPIMRLHEMGGEAMLDDLRDLFDRLCTLFGAPSYMRFDKLKAITRHFVRDDVLFHNAPTEQAQLAKHLLQLPDDQALKAWVHDTLPDLHRPRYAQLREAVQRPTKARDSFRSWAMRAQQRHVVKAASFHFRDSFQGPQARVSDPGHYLSDAAIRDFDALHIIQNCDAEYMDADTWSSQSDIAAKRQDENDIVFYARIRDLLPPENRLRLSFRTICQDECKAWEEVHVCQMTALLGLEVTTDRGQLPLEALLMLAEQYLPAFVAPQDHWIGGKLRGLATDFGLRCYTLEAWFTSGTVQHYYLMLGTAALLASAHLRRESAMFREQQAQADHDMIWS
jgi:CRISPR-associated endonuclease/helicase Cas3